MAYPHRCSNRGGKSKDSCGYRKSMKFKQHKEAMIHPPTCPQCKIGKMKYDAAHKRAQKEETCHCSGPPYDPQHTETPHRRGSSVWCEQHPTGPTSEDWEEYYGH